METINAQCNQGIGGTIGSVTLEELHQFTTDVSSVPLYGHFPDDIGEDEQQPDR